IPADLMARVYRRYDDAKRAQGWVDFEDLLELAIRLFDEDETALAELRDRYRAFTVDEYQDVNLLQQTLLERWLGDSDELCVVGDDFQSIYGFTGATPEYLLAMPRRFPHAQVFHLQENYRSTPEVLALANRLLPRGLHAVREPGPEPVHAAFRSPAAEAQWVAERIRELGIRWEDVAVLYRTNARSDDFEEALAEAEIPFQVRGGAFLERQAARRV